MNTVKKDAKRLIPLAVAALLTAGAFGTAVADTVTLPEVRLAQSESFEQGREALDEGDWDAARRAFAEAARTGDGNVDAALYWKAYAERHARHLAAAASTLAKLEADHPDSAWIDDAEVLRQEIRRSQGQALEVSEDDELKMYALQGLMSSDPDRAIPILEEFLKRDESPQLKERALFVLSQTRDPRGREMIREIAKDGSNPELQAKAIQMYVVMGRRASEDLADLYSETATHRVKKALLDAAMASGNYDLLERAMRDESAGELRVHAVHLLGASGRTDNLWQVFEGSGDEELRRAVVDAMAVAGDADGIARILEQAEEPEIRTKAIQSLGIMGRSRSGELIERVYAESTTQREKRAAIEALMIQGNGEVLKRLFRTETDPELRRHIVQMLAVTGGAESADFFAEILEDDGN